MARLATEELVNLTNLPHFSQRGLSEVIAMLQTSYESRNSKPLTERFWEKVGKKVGCWNWIGAKARRGCGVLWVNGKNMPAPRVSWELHFGKIPNGLFVCHSCNNPSCIKPKHLYLATHSQNLQDASADGLLSIAKDGESNPASRLTDKRILEIRRRYVHSSRKGPSTSKALAAEFNISQSWVRQIAKGTAWNHI